MVQFSELNYLELASMSKEKNTLTTDKDWIWHKYYGVGGKKRQEDKIVMQTRLPGETDASNILGSKVNLLKRKKKKKKNKAIQTEYT